MGKNKLIPASAVIGNIYIVYRDRQHTIPLRKVQVIGYNHPHINLRLIEKFDAKDGKDNNFYSVVNIQAIRQPVWKLETAAAPFPTPVVTPTVITNSKNNRGPKAIQGKRIEDIRVGDTWEVYGSKLDSVNQFTVIQIIEVTPKYVVPSVLVPNAAVRIHATIGRESFRDGRYKLRSRLENAPIVPRIPRRKNEVLQPTQLLLDNIPPVRQTIVEVATPVAAPMVPKQEIPKGIRVPIELLDWIARDRKNGTLQQSYQHMTYKGNIVRATKITGDTVGESPNILYNFEWNPDD